MTRRALHGLALAAAFVALGTTTSGCRLFRAAGRAAGSFFDSPAPVANKITDPVRKDARLAVLWVGHATALVQIDDKIILTDPVFTNTVGELSKRLVEPGIEAKNLPNVDAVVISHMHFDHLSLGSLSMIEPKVRMLLLPHGGTNYLTDFSFPSVELDPWEPWEKDGLRVTAVPVQHVGYRYGADGAWMTRSFTGYVIEYHGLKVYFGGDTAYDQAKFVETGQRFQAIDLALIPIGPIEPRDFMREYHMDPREALQSFIDIGARRMVPIHYDTFINSSDEPGDALRVLNEAKARYDLGKREVVPLAIGEQRVFLKTGDEPAPVKGWYPTDPAPAKPAPPPPKPVKKDEAPKDDIPEDERLD